MPTKKQLKEWEKERNRTRKRGGLVRIQIETLVPSKWLFVDQETGNVWKWDTKNNTFVHAESCST